MRPEEQHRVAAEKRGENSRPVHALWRWGLRREGQTDSPSLTLWGPEGGAAAQARMILPAVQGSACRWRAVAALAPSFQCALRPSPTSECKMRIAFVDLARAQEVHRHCKKGDLQQRTQIYHSVPRSACDPSLPLRRTSSAPSPWSSPPPLPPHPAAPCSPSRRGAGACGELELACTGGGGRGALGGGRAARRRVRGPRAPAIARGPARARA